MTLMPMNTSQLATASGINYHSSVCPVIERVNGEVETLPCSHNLLFDMGKNNTIMALMLTSGGPYTNITLINATAGVNAVEATGNAGWVPYTLNNLSSMAGAVTWNGIGNVSIAYTFTAQGDGLYLNATKLTNSTGGRLAGNTFPISLLNTGDRFTQTWTVWVE
jgi:hypothetical protein